MPIHLVSADRGAVALALEIQRRDGREVVRAHEQGLAVEVANHLDMAIELQLRGTQEFAVLHDLRRLDAEGGVRNGRRQWLALWAWGTLGGGLRVRTDAVQRHAD